MKTGYFAHSLCFWHDTSTNASLTPGDPTIGLQPHHHVEHPDTKRRVHELFEVSGLLAHEHRIRRMPERYATDEEILRVHTPRYVDHLKEQSAQPKGGDAGDGVTPFGKGGYEIARLAAGAVIDMTRAVYDGEICNGYALVRPPGHHARPDTGMGFCLLNNIAIAIHALKADNPDVRVAVVDWDVHHGNGTEETFYSDPNVLTISIHQNGVFPPDSGGMNDRGEGAGHGYNLNIPLPAGSQRAAYLYAMDQVITPALERYQPDIILVACGYDANVLDPMSWVAIDAETYRELTETLLSVADEVCNGKVVMAHEGGYAPMYVPFCALAVMETLTGISTGIEDPHHLLTGQWMTRPLQRHEIDVVKDAAKLVKDIKPGKPDPAPVG